MAGPTFSGGEKLRARLAELVKNSREADLVKVGFFEGSTESRGGASTPMVAYCNEYGLKKPGEEGDVVRPPRPFFRRMIAAGQKHWGADLAAHLKYYREDAGKALAVMGLQMGEELQASIAADVYPKLADSTVARKGFSQTLIDSGDMQEAVDFEVD